MQKCRKIDLYYIYQGEFTKFSTFAKEVNSKPLSIKNWALLGMWYK